MEQSDFHLLVSPYLPQRMIISMSVPEMLAIGLPTLSVLVGILLNRSDTNRLDARITTEIAALKASVTAENRELRADIALIRSDQREFYRTLGQHEVRIDNLEKK